MIYSLTESKRFRMNIFRESIEYPDILNVDGIKNELSNFKVDILFIRVNSILKHDQFKLTNIGYPILHCDSLVYYKYSLIPNKKESLRNDLNFIAVDKNNFNILREIIPSIFDNYQNHYYSNPLLNRKDILDGYIEWVISSIIQNKKDEITWIVYNNSNKVVGFAKCSFNIENSSCEGILFGVLPEYSNGGIYTDLIRFTKNYFTDLGIDTMIVSTQLQNYTVQKIWNREGFFMYKSYDTYHINSLLAKNNI